MQLDGACCQGAVLLSHTDLTMYDSWGPSGPGPAYQDPCRWQMPRLCVKGLHQPYILVS